MSNLDRLRAAITETGGGEQPTKLTEPGFVSFVSAPQGRVSTIDVLKEWRRGLALVDPRKPRASYDAAAWHTLCEDAAWLLDTFGERAERDDWSAADLFGLWPDKPGWGGIADRLRGARSLVMTADRAHWRSWGQMERFNRGAYPNLRPVWLDLKIYSRGP